ncbi:N-acetylglucosamine-6-phosphate deacetylase [Athalassotoga sp.]|uniref:N-acetylglucosamine-6-phosphate deacetylase n=1 Tax=Athalassotoga sp. TaxID=2022597 RepID=UPI003CFD25F1
MRIENVKIVDPFFSVENGWIEFEESITGYGYSKKSGSSSILMPGFVDTHVHGGSGYDFMDEKIDFDKVEKHFFSTGVTSVLATTLTAPVGNIRNAIDAVRKRIKENPITPLKGVHLEGPVISKKHVGAQNPDFILKGTLSNLKEIIQGNEDFVKIMTIAVEESDDEAIGYLQSKGITISVGHSDATFEQFMHFYKLGVKHMTHFCNAMTPLHHRKIGLVGAGLKLDDVDLELISDGIHLDEEMISLILKFHPHDRIIAITDAMRAAGLKDGEYDLGGLKVKVKDNSARLEDGTLAGSVLKYNEGLKRLHDLGLNLNEIAVVSSFKPSTIVKSKDPIGRIMPGYDADFVIMDDNFSVLKVFKKGKIVFSKEGG